MIFCLDFVEFQRCQKPKPMVPGHLTRPLVYQKFNLASFELDQCRNSPRIHRHYVNVMADNISCPTHFPKDKTECKVDSLNSYCENTLSQQGIHEELFTFTIYSIPQNKVICTT